jgi:hypothetical protein
MCSKDFGNEERIIIIPCDFDQSDKIISYGFGVRICGSRSNK